jgi:Alcohol dehydrogenase, class IV
VQARPDVIVGYGGGSALDLAKSVAVLLAHGGPLDRFYGENALPGDVLPIVAVPTTAGTGSEVTPVAVVSDPSRTLKVGISDPRLIPRVAVVDPDLSSGAPAAVTAYAGADALVHALESLTARPRVPDWGRPMPVFVGRNSLSSLLALEAAEAIGRALPAAVADGADTVARDRMAWGSMLAGMAFGSAGTHLAHALQYPIGALTKTPHGLGTGMLLPYVLQACRDAVPAELSAVGPLWGLDGGDETATAQAVIDRVAEIGEAIGLPRTLADMGLDRERIPEVARLGAGVTRLVDNSPIPTDEGVLHDILEAAYTGDRDALNNRRTA